MKWPFRTAAILLLVFFLGHTGGGMLAQKSLGVASDGVFTAMKTVHFDFNGADSTWYGFWFGFGLMASVFLLFSAAVAWRLGDVSPRDWRVVAPIAWALVLSHVANAVLSFRYFFAGPGVFATAVVLLLTYGSWRKARLAESA